MENEPGSETIIISSGKDVDRTAPTERPLPSDDPHERNTDRPPPMRATPMPASLLDADSDDDASGEDEEPSDGDRTTLVIEDWAMAMEGVRKTVDHLRTRLFAIAQEAGHPHLPELDGIAVLRLEAFFERLRPFTQGRNTNPALTVPADARAAIRLATGERYRTATEALRVCASSSDPRLQRDLQDLRRFYEQAVGIR